MAQQSTPRTAVPHTAVAGDPAPSPGREPVQVVARTQLPAGGELVLLQCGQAFSIELGNEELMGSTDHGSEEALARLSADRVGAEAGTVLIGGLGMGFTLGAALSAWGPRARLEVAELVPAVIDWARGPLAHLFGDSLDDPRLTLRLEDVHDVIDRASDHYDAILLDVDNGPDGFVQAANDRLYCNWGLRAAHQALRPGGVLAVWSSYRDADFAERLRQARFSVDEVLVPAFEDAGDDEQHCIWLASKASLNPPADPRTPAAC